MRVCLCHRLMHWPDGGTPSCHEGRRVREVKNRRGAETGLGGGGSREMKNEQGETGKHLQPNAIILI